jgi:hypothetical protein
MAIDLGDIPTGTPPTAGEKLQIRSAIGVGTTDAPTFLGLALTGTTNQLLKMNASNWFGTDTSQVYLYNSGLASPVVSLNNGSNIAMRYDWGLAWTAGASTGSLDLILARDAAGILAQRNGVNAQAFRVANSVGASPLVDYDRGVFDFKTTTNTLGIGTENGGTYTTARPIEFVTGGVVRISIAAAGTVSVVGTLDVPTYSTAGVPFMSHIGSAISIGHSSLPLQMTGNRLAFNGTTSAFPAIKRSGTGIHIVLADDSSFAPITCGSLVANSHLRTTDTSQIGWLNTRSSMISPSDGVIRLTNNAGTSYTRLELGEADMGIMRGTGTPENIVTAKVGSIYLRTDGTSGSSFYVKESSPTPSTGWVAK